MSLKAQREPVRKALTKALDDVKLELAKANPDKLDVKLKFDRASRHAEKLHALNEQLEQNMLAEDSDEKAFQEEYDVVTEYNDSYNEVFIKIQPYLVDEVADNSACSTKAPEGRSRKYRLPKLEFLKYDGDPKEWISFWSQFKNIHDDEDMGSEEKFQYLIQATKENSAARTVVSSFPPSAENYPKVVQYLKERFGRDEILVEVYVRELLSLVISNLQKKGTSSLSAIYDNLETQLRALESLGVTSDKYAAMLYPLVESSLPEETIKIWERSRSLKKEDNQLNSLMAFIRTEVDGEQRINMARKGFLSSGGDKKGARGKQSYDIPTATDLYSGESRDSPKTCVFCERNHQSSDCRQASTMSLEQKKKKIIEKKVCYICFRGGHIARKCKLKVSCPVCGKPHFAIMCPQVATNKPQQQSTVVEVKKPEGETSSLSNYGVDDVVLQTILVKLRNGNEERIVRALLDTGSQHSYITKQAADVMGYQPIGQVEMAHGLFGGHATQKIEHNVFGVSVYSLDGHSCLQVKVLEQNKICGSVGRFSPGVITDELKRAGIQVTDVGLDNTPPAIHLLFGADNAGELFTGRMYHTSLGPVAMETKLGWTVMGKQERKLSDFSCGSSLLVNSLFSSTVTMESLCKLDVLGIRDPIEVKTEEQLMECAVTSFEKSVMVTEDGRFEVALPWLEHHPPVSEYFEGSKKRLNSATRKLEGLGKFDEYEHVFQEWSNLGIIEEVPKSEWNVPGSYLPHRPVFNPSSTTTPIRPVFDASARSKGSPSLNDCLLKGPNLIELVPAILTRFRMRKVGVTSDIKKAFLQISMKKEDRDFLRFLWWEKGRKDLKMFRHCRVVFGVSSSPFLLAATLNHLLDRVKEEDKQTAGLLKKSLYVDNCICSLDSVDETKEFERNCSRIMMDGKFELRGWMSTDGAAAHSEIVSILGVLWDMSGDHLKIDLGKMKEVTEGSITKKKILSAAHRFYDPLGLFSPVSIIPKMILQELWEMKLDWDEEVPEKHSRRFLTWIRGLDYLSGILIPRWVMQAPVQACKLSLHGFGDASKDAYAGCVFLRSEYMGNVKVQLMMSKSRVAPKKATIPRLELLSCLLAARLVSTVMKYMEIEVEIKMWTDSANALYWIRNTENWSVFIFNRVQEIRRLTDVDFWRHIPGEQNPADLPSRGCSGKQFREKHWWEGTYWLYESTQNWPKSSVNADMDVILAEKKKTTINQLVVDDRDSWYYRYSSFKKIVAITAWMLRVCKKGRGMDRSKLVLSTGEKDYAEKVLWKKIQAQSFPDKKLFKQMHAGKDAIGLRRVRSKIVMREDTEDFTFPILLPSQHHLVKLMIREEHLKNRHVGVNTLMSLLRERYWIIKTRRTVKDVVSGCLRCRRFQGKSLCPEEPPLPVDRIRDAELFEVVGVDLGGPLYLQRQKKIWFVVFSCAIFRAIHLELVSALSTESFTKSLRRFIARRGRPSIIYSDNGTNFVGLANLMKELDWADIGMKTQDLKIEWRFNVPAGPWWGGWYERMVGMVKKLLRPSLGRQTLSFEDLQTVMYEIEALINSRPLTYVSEDVEDPMPLTPAMLLGTKRSHGTADLDLLDATAFQTKFRDQEKIRVDLAKRFRTEYLGALIHRDKYKTNKSVAVGDVVIVELENASRMEWPLGRVVEVFPGRDGIVRKATVKTKTSSLSRAVQKLYPLEVRI